MSSSLVGDIPCMSWDGEDLEAAWKSFRQHIEFMFSGPLKSCSEVQKCSYLMLWVGEKGRNIFSTWTLTEEEGKKLETYFNNFEAYVKPRCSNVIYNRYKFLTRFQGQYEPFEQFATDLQVKVKDCQYDQSDNIVRDAIVIGVKNAKLREKLINIGSDLTLAKTLDVVRTYEVSHNQAISMSAGSRCASEVNAIQGRKHKHQNNNFNKRSETHSSSYKGGGSQESSSSSKCSRCGYVKRTNLHKCPAEGKSCKKCNGKDHFASMCKTKADKPNKPRRVHVVDGNDSDCLSSSDEFFVGYIDINSVDEESLVEWTEKINISDRNIKFQLDTGAQCSIIPYNVVKDMKATTEIMEPKALLKSYSGHKITSEGKVTLSCKVDGKTYRQVFEVVKGNVRPILGAQACSKMKLVQRTQMSTQQTQTQVNEITNPKSEDKLSIPDDIKREYGDLFRGLGCMPGVHTIKTDSSVTPVVHAPRKVPFALKDRVKIELERMEQEGVVVKQEEPTPWVNSMVTVVKPNGKIRICIDPKYLNKAILREHYPMKTIEDVISNIPKAKVFSKLDATSGFWQLKPDDESSKLCTFNSPFGRYSFTRLPFGIKSAPKVYQRAISEMVQDLDGCDAIIVDILIWGEDNEQHDERLNKVLDRVREFNLKLSPDKCKFRQSEVTYVGHKLTSAGVKPDDEKIRAVLEMSEPENKKELQTVLGFITYLGKFLPNLSEKSAPLRKLLNKDIEWRWEYEQEESFRTLIKLVTGAPVLRYFDPEKELTLTVDASSTGLGAALVQEGQPIAYASRALTETQQRYAQIEKETLAITFGCEKYHQFIFGREVIIESDHKPLQSIFRKPLNRAPPRLQRLLLSLQKYTLNVVYKPGKSMFLADTLNRSYLNETKEDLVFDIAVNQILAYLPITAEKYQEFKRETSEDDELKQLREIILAGWPETKEEVPNSTRHYWTFRDELSCVDGLLFKNHRLVVPSKLRSEMLKTIHNSHLGIVKCKSRAREVLYWSGMSAEVEDTVSKCPTCAKTSRKNSKEPLMETETPNRPWSVISSDIFELKGQNYLVTVDHYSKWPELAKLDNMSSSNTMSYLKSQMSRYGIPDRLVTDNGPQFSNHEFQKFAASYGFEHLTSSPTFAQSNGQVERTVQTVKNIIRKSDDPYKGLLAYRNTVIDEIGLSPAQMFFGRRLKSDLPTTAPLLSPDIMQTSDLKMGLKNRKEKNKIYYDQHAGKELSPLENGENIIFQNNEKWIPGKVIAKHQNPRSYIVETQKGRKYRRNRKDIKPTRASFTLQNENTPVNVDPVPRKKVVKEQDKERATEQPIATRCGRAIKLPHKYQ